MLHRRCEEGHLYLQHDITLQQLATAIGTNRTYLSTYFTLQGTTYSAYINRLRVEHFIHQYRQREAQIGADSDSLRPFTALELAQQSGYCSYSTFSAAFKKFTGFSVTTWIKSERESR